MSDAKKPNDGGPAFPVGTRDISGMSLRDYFAAAALTGVIGGTVCDFDRLGGEDPELCEAGDVARKAYAIADAMLAESAKREGR